VMPQYGLEPQVVMTFPLLVGIDGELKMSKSRGNYIGITEPPEEMFGKVMSIPDTALEQWWTMLAEGPHPEDPLEWKLELARRITARWHGEEGAKEGEAHFTRVVREGGAPADVPELPLPEGDPVHLPALLVDGLGVASTSEARRLIQQGAVKLNGEPAPGLDVPREVLVGALLQAGKRRFARLTRVGPAAILPGPSERISAYARSLSLNQGASRPDSVRYDSFPRRPLARVAEVFFTPSASSARHRSLKTQQRTFFDVETSISLDWPCFAPNATSGWVRVINLVVKADSSESVETAFEQHARSGVRRSMSFLTACGPATKPSRRV